MFIFQIIFILINETPEMHGFLIADFQFGFEKNDCNFGFSCRAPVLALAQRFLTGSVS